MRSQPKTIRSQPETIKHQPEIIRGQLEKAKLPQVCYIREKAEKGAPDGICCAEGSVRFRTQMSENSRLESIKGVTELKSNKPAKVKSTFEAINFFKKIVKFVP